MPDVISRAAGFGWSGLAGALLVAACGGRTTSLGWVADATESARTDDGSVLGREGEGGAPPDVTPPDDAARIATEEGPPHDDADPPDARGASPQEAKDCMSRHLSGPAACQQCFCRQCEAPQADEVPASVEAGRATDCLNDGFCRTLLDCAVTSHAVDLGLPAPQGCQEIIDVNPERPGTVLGIELFTQCLRPLCAEDCGL